MRGFRTTVIMQQPSQIGRANWHDESACHMAHKKGVCVYMYIYVNGTAPFATKILRQ